MQDPQSRAPSDVLPEAAVALVFVLYACFALSLGNAPLQDAPNHLTRAHIIGDLLAHGGGTYGHWFTFDLSFVPYLGGDLALSALEGLFGESGAARIWITSAVLLLPLSIRFALLAQGASRTTALIGATLAFYLATSAFFSLGFLNYLLATAVAVFAYGFFLQARDTGKTRPYLAFLALVALGYLLHLSALIFSIAITGTSLLISIATKRLSIWQTAKFIAPPLALLAFHFVVAEHFSFIHWTNHAAAVNEWGTWTSKLFRISKPFDRFKVGPEMLLLVAFLCIAVAAAALRLVTSVRARAEDLLLCAMLFVLYLVLPQVSNDVYDVDIRAIPYAVIFLLFAGAKSYDAAPRARYWGLWFAALFAIVNLAFLAAYMLPQNAAMGRYKQIARLIPPGSTVLPIDTRRVTKRYEPFIHAGSYVTSDAAGITPYLFASDIAPAMSYFSYIKRDYAPSEFWYTHSAALDVANVVVPGRDPTPYVPRWNEIAQIYQYVIITAPWDPGRIPLHYTIVAQNDAAALLKLSR